LGIGHGANDLTLEKFIVTKPSPWMRSKLIQDYSTSKEEEEDMNAVQYSAK
jgi:hypothetical protein